MISESINLFTQPAPPQAPTCRDFDGETFEHEHDAVRLSGNNAAVFNLMVDGKYRTHSEIRAEARLNPETAIGPRIRDLKKSKFGGHTVIKRRRGEPKDGVWEYKLIVNQSGGAG